MADSVDPAATIDNFVSNATLAIRSTYYTMLKSSLGAAVFCTDLLFDIPYIAGWHKIGIRIQALTDYNTARKNARRADYNYVVGINVLIRKDGILCTSEYRYDDPYTITQVNTNGTIRVQRRSKSERLNIRRMTPYFTAASDDGDN